MSDAIARDELALERLAPEAFAPFGEVISLSATTPGWKGETINRGLTERFADLARIDVAADGGTPTLHLYRSHPVSLPLSIEVMERHPLGSQAFVPLHSRPFVVIVAPAGDDLRPEAIRAFVTDGTEGVNLARGVWHHYQVSLYESSDYLVIERAGPGTNFEERRIDPPLVLRRT